MKNLVFQKEFIDNLLFNPSAIGSAHADLTEFLVSEFEGYNLVCDFESYRDYELAAIDNPILEAMLDKFINISYKPNLLDDFKKDEFYDSLSERNIFLTCLDKEECERLSVRRGYAFVSSDDIDATWGKYNLLKKGVVFKVTQSKDVQPDFRFENWVQISELSHPATGIIIFDKHILNISPKQVKVNLVPLISNLIRGTFKDRKPTITIVSEPKTGFFLKDYVLSIQEELKSQGIEGVKLNIVRHNKAFYPNGFEGLHARIIVTNIMHLVSDACFNYFRNGKVVNVANLTAKLGLCCFNGQSYQKDIGDLKTYIARVKKSASVDPKYGDTFFPDKQNPLLN